MRLRKSVTTETFQLSEDSPCIFLRITLLNHPTDKLVFKMRDLSLGLECRHAAAQFIRFRTSKSRANNRDLHGLLLEQRYPKCSLQNSFQLRRRILDRLLTIATAQIR